MQYVCVISSEGLGGVWTVVKESIIVFKEHYEVKLILIVRKGKVREDVMTFLDDNSIPVLLVSISFSNGWLFDFAKAWHVREMRSFIGNRRSIIHSHDSFAAGFYMCFLRSCKYYKFCTFHGTLLPALSLYDKIRNYFTLIIRVKLLVLSNAEFISCDPFSIPILKTYINGDKYIHLAVNGVGPFLEQKVVHDDFNVAYMSRFHPLKGWNILGAAVDLLIDQGYKLNLIFAGSGECEEEIKDFCKHRSYCTYVGHIGNLQRDLFPIVDLHILPTNYPEGLPMIILETMAAGIPTITTDVGSNRIAVSDGVNGYITAGNINSLADTLRKVLDNKRKLNSVSDACKEIWLTQFSSVKMVDSYISIFETYINEITN